VPDVPLAAFAFVSIAGEGDAAGDGFRLIGVGRGHARHLIQRPLVVHGQVERAGSVERRVVDLLQAAEVIVLEAVLVARRVEAKRKPNIFGAGSGNSAY
jgi:hypothetical protein